MAELNRRIFSGESDDADFGVDVGDSIFRDGEMLPTRLKNAPLPLLVSIRDCLKRCLLMKGTAVAPPPPANR